MRHPSRVHELIPLVNGLFAHMDYQFWDFTSEELEILMHSRFGQRPVAPLLDIIQGPPDDPFACRKMLTDEQLTLLASIILKTYRNKWDRLGAIHSLEYDVLKNYLDEYQEVVRDDTDESTERELSKSDEDSQVSRLTTTSGTEGEQSNVSSNESTNTRNDDFMSEFSRVSKDLQTRTDDLEESKVRSEVTASIRTDDLEESTDKTTTDESVRTDALRESTTKNQASSEQRVDALTDTTTGTGTEDVTHSGGTYQESTEKASASTGNKLNSTGIYGFNSIEPVDDSTSNTDANMTERETATTQYSGSKSDSSSSTQDTTVEHTGNQLKQNVGSEDASKSNTGTQTTAADGHEVSLKTNSGSQQTDTDVDETYIKANRGTQGIEEDVSITDATHTSDEQESMTKSYGANSGKTSSSAITDTDNEVNRQAVSRLNDSVIVNRALARAKQSVHKGNIGNLTPQQLITQEIELWRWNFIDEVMSDIKSMITIPIYI